MPQLTHDLCSRHGCLVQGHSFHFSPGVKGASYADHSRLHEEALADAIDLKEGMTALDAGYDAPVHCITGHLGQSDMLAWIAA